MSRSGRVALSDVWEARPYVREWSGSPPGCPKVVEMPFRMFGSGQDGLSDLEERSGGPPGCLGLVESPFQMSWSCREAPQMSWIGAEAIQDVQEWS